MSSDGLLRIGRRFNGPPDSAHGGVACGVFASVVDPRSALVRLLSPPPLETDLVAEPDGDDVIVSGPDGPVAKVGTYDTPPPPPLPWVDKHELEAAGRTWSVLAENHVFPTCFGCGHLRPDGDGLELYAGPIPGSDLAAAVWTPGTSLAEPGSSTVAHWATWGAVDCPSGGAVVAQLAEGRAMMLGELAFRIAEAPAVGQEYQVVARSKGADGRRLRSEVGVVAPDGRNLARGAATWITIDPTNQGG